MAVLNEENLNMKTLPLTTNPFLRLRRLTTAAAVFCAGALVQSSDASLLHHWSFNTDGTDSIGGATAAVQGAATISGGMLNLPGGGTFVNYASVDLGNTISNN